MAFHAIEVYFPLEFQPLRWRHKPGNFIAHFVGHEGPGSLLSYLKNKGWVNTLHSGPQLLARGFSMFKVTIYLTQEGFSKYFHFCGMFGFMLTLSRSENHRSVMVAIFKYLSLLRSSELPAWYQREMSLMSQTRFRFKEKTKPESYAVWVSSHMEWPVPRDLVLAAPQLIWEWDEPDHDGSGLEEIRRVLDSFTIDKGRAVLMAKPEEHDKIGASDAVWEKEPIYGTCYRVEKLEKDFVEQVNCLSYDKYDTVDRK
jgi:insulysin